LVVKEINAMKYPERVKIVESLPYESRIGFIAFCVERCLKEARRHPAAREQLEKLPQLTEGVEMLWARAKRGIVPEPERIDASLAHLSTYERPAADSENVVYNFDVTLVEAARMLTKGMRVLQNPQATPRYVAGAFEGALQSVGAIYADWQNARNAERTIADTALQRLQEWGNRPFSHAVFEGIPEWTRGELSRMYAENRVKGSALDDDE